jgi:putative transposase
MQVSRSGYYAWLKRPESAHSQKNEQLVKQIKAIYEKSRQTYGSPRIHEELKDRGVLCSENRIARLMRQHGIAVQRKRKFTRTTDSNHRLPIAPNRLDQQFEVSRPAEVWTADITYIWTREGWLYLAVVVDLFSRRVVGWSMASTLERALVVTALKMAIMTRNPDQGLTHHSDRGSQYASSDYQKLLQQKGIVVSMSRRGNCYDNAPTESWFATLKRELVHRRNYATQAEARQDIFEYIEVWYNRQRKHSAIGYMSPIEYEQQWEKSTATAA